MDEEKKEKKKIKKKIYLCYHFTLKIYDRGDLLSIP